MVPLSLITLIVTAIDMTAKTASGVKTISDVRKDLWKEASVEVSKRIEYNEPLLPHFNSTWLQKSLNELGIEPKLDVDGYAGDKTVINVKTFQKALVLRKEPDWEEKDIDGMAGIKTCIALFNELDRKRHPEKYVIKEENWWDKFIFWKK